MILTVMRFVIIIIIFSLNYMQYPFRCDGRPGNRSWRVRKILNRDHMTLLPVPEGVQQVYNGHVVRGVAKFYLAVEGSAGQFFE